jgi:2-isopropylmalate synthase
LVDRIKRLEHVGFQFEAADGSLKLLLEEALGRYQEAFVLDHYSVVTERDVSGKVTSRAEVAVIVDGQTQRGEAGGSGPVHVLDLALRKALGSVCGSLVDVRLVDYKVRVLDAGSATAARVRVLIESQDSEESWTTVGVSDNILDASWGALSDAVNYKLLKESRSAAQSVTQFTDTELLPASA